MKAEREGFTELTIMSTATGSLLAVSFLQWYKKNSFFPVVISVCVIVAMWIVFIKVFEKISQSTSLWKKIMIVLFITVFAAILSGLLQSGAEWMDFLHR